MELKLACADFAFPLLPHNKVLDVIAMLEMDGVDIGLFQDRSHLQPFSEFENLNKNANELKNRLNDRKLEPADIFLQTARNFVTLAINHPESEKRKIARELFVKTLEYASICGSKHVTILPGVYFKDEDEQISLERCCEELRWRCDIASKHQITFSIEAHLGSIVPTPEKALDLLAKIPGLTLTLDYTHFERQGVAQERVEPLISHASHFHARGANTDKIQTIFDENTIDYQRIVKIMKEMNYIGYIGIEYNWEEWENCNRTDNISETIQMRDFIKKCSISVNNKSGY